MMNFIVLKLDISLFEGRKIEIATAQRSVIKSNLLQVHEFKYKIVLETALGIK